MRVRRLGWAGLEIESTGTTVLVDAVEEAEPLRSILPAESLPAARAGGAAAALVTHLHSDHADPAAIARALAPDGVVFRPFPAQGTAAENVWTAQAEAGFAARSPRGTGPLRHPGPAPVRRGGRPGWGVRTRGTATGRRHPTACSWRDVRHGAVGPMTSRQQLI